LRHRISTARLSFRISGCCGDLNFGIGLWLVAGQLPSLETYASIPLEHSRRARDTRYGDYDRRLLGTLPSIEHVMAQEEVKRLLRQLKLPIDEGGRRRAADRAEWFNQLNKPIEVYDIFGAPEIGFQTGDRLGPRLA
jgi:hypothetical protein